MLRARESRRPCLFGLPHGRDATCVARNSSAGIFTEWLVLCGLVAGEQPGDRARHGATMNEPAGRANRGIEWPRLGACSRCSTCTSGGASPAPTGARHPEHQRSRQFFEPTRGHGDCSLSIGMTARSKETLGYTGGVNVRAKQLLDEVLDLPAEEREAFAAKLLETLDAAPDARTDAEWAAELERRLAETLDPNWKGRTWDEVRAEVERTLRASRGG